MLETPVSQSHMQAEADSAQYASQQEVPTISCPVCDAVYAPPRSQVAFFSSDALEAAFMSMCHFCFRCRRPSCPQCWDSVHGVCGACVDEANLSFRSEAAPRDGMLFRPLYRQERGQQEVAALLTCVKPGFFQQDGEQGNAEPTETAGMVIERIPALVANMDEPVKDAHHKATSVTPAAITEAPRRETEKVTIAQTRKAGEENKGEDEDEDEDDGEYLPHPIMHAFHVIERVLTVLALVLLLAIVALVIAAQASEAANTAILRVLHVDIRAEVAYLVHLVQQLRQ